MHPLTCYAGQINLCHAKIEKILKKLFVMINKGGGDIELMGGPPVPALGKTLPGMAVFGRSAVVSRAFKKQFYKELQTPFRMENNNKNNRTIKKTIKN